MEWERVQLVLWPLFRLLYQPQMTGDDDDDNDCGAIGGMRIGRGNRSTRRKPAPVPLYPPQVPSYFNLARTQAAAVGSWRLTAWAMARPNSPCFTCRWIRKDKFCWSFMISVGLLKYSYWIYWFWPCSFSELYAIVTTFPVLDVFSWLVATLMTNIWFYILSITAVFSI
jgi:hypothetical protein